MSTRRAAYELAVLFWWTALAAVFAAAITMALRAVGL